MFDPHIYACQSFVSIDKLNWQKNEQNVNALPVQSPGSLTPQRKQSQQEEETLIDQQFHVNNNNNGSASNSGDNSRKTSTISDGTSSDHTPENTIVTPRQSDNEMVDPLHFVKQSPVRKLSRFLVSPTIIETANKELIVQEDVPQHAAAVEAVDIEININEEANQKIETAPSESQQSISGFKMPETLEQLKIELENITHAHVSTKAKELLSNQPQSLPPEIGDEITEPISSEAHVESSAAEYPSMTDQTVGSMTTGDNTSVYNSRRTSTDMNPNDLASAASDRPEEENLVNDVVADDGSKLLQMSSTQTTVNIER